MDTQQIQNLLDAIVKPGCDFLGVFPFDKIPTPRNFPSCYVTNTDPSDLPGQHWLALYFPSDGQCEFFDSFALPHTLYSLNIQHDTISNSKQLQSHTSTACGQHCIYYLYHRSHDHSMYSITSSFTSNYEWNDSQVERFVRKLTVPNIQRPILVVQTCKPKY